MRYAMCVLVVVLGATACGFAAPAITKGPDGLIRVTAYPMADEFKNPAWPADLEEGFWKRANHAIKHYAGNNGGATTGEHEKWGYPKAMFAILAGNIGPNVNYLQAADGEQSHTLGVDFYWCFCLKNQPRKYFWYGKHAGLLNPAYLDKMRKAAAIWTKDDPKPTLELYRQINHPDREVREYALSLLNQFRVPKKDLPALLAKSSHQPFKDYMTRILPQWSDDADLGADPAKWSAWCKLIMDGDWQTYEEYERIANPNPHPKYGHGKGPIGGSWDPATRGLWSDGRNTDNLRSMREISVYLFAEEAGNEKIRKLYKDKLKTFVVGLYHVGMGEWDSETYHSHTIAPWLGLYDFAKDPEVKKLAKAALDWLVAAAAVKYYRGGYGGPVKRDYGGGNVVFGAGTSHLMYLYFGDCPIEDPSPHYDDVHAVTSNYRPPLAVVELARKNFAPAEMHNTKPEYSHWRPGHDKKPEFYETLNFGKTYYLGTLAARGGSGDVGPFKMLAYNSKRGCDFFVAYQGSKPNTFRHGDQIGQFGNLCVWLNKAAKGFKFQVPKTATVETSAKVWFIKMEKTWIALHPINLGTPETGGVSGKGAGKYAGEMLLNCKVTDGPAAGFAMEVGEMPTSFDAFRKAVLARGGPSTKGAAVMFTSSTGNVMEMYLGRMNNLPTVVRNGVERKWETESDLYKPVGAAGPMSLGWKTGTLKIAAGGHTFTQTVTKDGKVTWYFGDGALISGNRQIQMTASRRR